MPSGVWWGTCTSTSVTGLHSLAPLPMHALSECWWAYADSGLIVHMCMDPLFVCCSTVLLSIVVSWFSPLSPWYITYQCDGCPSSLLCGASWLGCQPWEQIDHFTVVCLVARPPNESEAGVDPALTETSVLFICKFLLISMRTASLTWEKQGGFYQNKVTSSHTFIQRPGK